MEQKQKSIFCFCFVLLAILVGFYWSWLFGRQAFYLSDLTYYFEPLSRFVGDTLRQGRLPLWNPYSFCGMPEIAIPSPGIFYPLAWLFAMFPFSQALALSMVLHQFVIGLGSYLLVFSLGWGALPAAVFGFTMALCGYMFSLQANYTLVDTAAWIPFCLWSLGKIDAHRSFRNAAFFLLAWLCCFMLVSAGRPEVSTPGLLLLVVYAVGAYVTRVQNTSIATTVFRICAIVCGVMAAAPTLLPSAEWATLSARAHGLAASEVFLWSSNWYDFVVMILAHPLGDLHVLGNKFLAIGASRGSYVPYVPSAYIGPIVFTLALWGICDRPWKFRPYILALLIGALVMVLGNYTPIAPWIISLSPALAVFRYPEKLLIFFTAVVAFLAARGTYLSCRQQVTKWGSTLAWCFWSVWCFISLMFLLLPNLSKWIALTWKLHHTVDLNLVSQSQILFGQAGFSAGLVGLGVCCLGHFYAQMDNKTYSLMLLSALLSTFVVSAVYTSRHDTEPQFYEHPAYLQEVISKLNSQSSDLPGSRVLSLFFDPLTYPSDYKAFSGEDYTPNFYQYGRQMLLPNTHMDAHVRSTYGYEGAETADYRKLFWGVFKQSHAFVPGNKTLSNNVNDLPLYRFCQMTSTEYVNSQAYVNVGQRKALPLLDEKYFDLKFEDQSMNVRVYKVLNTLSRVYFPNNWIWSNSTKDTISSLIHNSNFDPVQIAFVQASGNMSNLLSDNSGAVTVRDLHITEINPENIKVSLKLSRPTMMVLADHFYPGWEAKIDGKSTPIYRANAILKAVFVPAGSHEINFVYSPESLALGFELALLASLIVFAVAVFLGVRRFKNK